MISHVGDTGRSVKHPPIPAEHRQRPIGTVELDLVQRHGLVTKLSGHVHTGTGIKTVSAFRWPSEAKDGPEKVAAFWAAWDRKLASATYSGARA